MRNAGVGSGARQRTVALVVVFSSMLCLGAFASVAWAGKGVVGVFGAGGAGEGQFANAAGTAVNLASGDVYVVDQFGFRVEQFNGAGAFVRAFGWGVADGSAAAQTCSSNCQGGLQGNGDGQFDTPQGIAIDQSDGSVYVVDGNNSRIEKFDASGVYQSQFGTAGSGDGEFSGPQGVAVAGDGSVYVADTGNHRVEKFNGAGVFQSQFGSEGSGDGQFEGPTRLAVDSTDQVYVLDSGNGRIERFTSAGAFDQVFDSTDVFLPVEIAVGPGNDHLYVAQTAQDLSEQRVIEIDSAGSLVDTHAVGSTANNASGLALNSGSQKIYLADGFNARVFILDDITAPAVSVDPAANVASTSTSLSGSVTPNGDPNVGWHFEISTDDANWSPTAGDQDAGNGNSSVPVAQNLTGLVPNTTYFVRLAATRPFNLGTFSSEVQFDTPAVTPDATTQQAWDMTPTQATVQGEIHPHHSPTTYFFEYGPTTAYGSSAPATQDASAGSADAPGTVYRRLSGLQQGTTYHYRLVAANQAGTVRGADQTFTTTVAPPESTARAGIPGAGLLPDQRGWEKVSPDDKNGGDIMADAGRTQIATDGSAARFASLAAFADAIGTSVATDYMSLRGPGGWTTHAITPHQASTTYLPILRGLQSLYLGLSSDLSEGVFVGWSPVTNDPNVARVANIYLRDDPKAPGAGSYQLMSVCPLCAATNTPLPPLLGNINGGGQPRFEGASTNFGHVIFGSQQPLTDDAPSGCTDLADTSQCPANLYEWDHGILRLAGILPDSQCVGPPPCAAHGSQAGQDAGPYQGAVALAPHTISADGSRIFFTVPTAPQSPSGALYMRVNHTSTVQLNTTERMTTPDPNPGQSAEYWDASIDGQRVFFTSSEALTNDAPTGGTNNLYMYDASKPGSDPHNLTLVSVDNEPADGGSVVNVQGVSSDGHYIYFAAAGQLVVGQPVLGADRALYVWHDGIVKYITTMHEFTDNVEDTNTNSWSLYQPTARVTPDGLHLLFSSSRSGVGPTGYDQGNCQAIDAGCREFYLYSHDSQRLACVSCNPTGAAATASAFTAQRLNTGVSATSPAQNHPLTDDGQHVFFSTAEALVPQDTNSRVDVYEYDAPSGTVHLITTGTERSDSYFMDTTPSGNDALFLTRAKLMSADVDNSYDLYDARVDGGFTEPLPSPQVCSSDACQGPQGSVPDAATPGSSLTGSKPSARAKTKAKPKPKPKCRKGHVRKKVHGKVKCVKKRKARVTHRKVSKAKRSRSLRRAK